MIGHVVCYLCYLGHVFDASWLYVPDGSSYLGSWCFTYCMALISPCGLMDTSYWLIRLVFHIEEESEYAFHSYIHWYILTVFP